MCIQMKSAICTEKNIDRPGAMFIVDRQSSLSLSTNGNAVYDKEPDDRVGALFVIRYTFTVVVV